MAEMWATRSSKSLLTMPPTPYLPPKYASKWVCDERLGRSNYCGGLYSGLHNLWHVHDCMELGVVNALAHSVTVVRAGWSHSQKRMPCARVLVDCLDNSQSLRTSSTTVNVADQQCKVLPKPRFNSHLEQPSRMGWRGRFGRTQN